MTRSTPTRRPSRPRESYRDHAICALLLASASVGIIAGGGVVVASCAGLLSGCGGDPFSAALLAPAHDASDVLDVAQGDAPDPLEASSDAPEASPGPDARALDAAPQDASQGDDAEPQDGAVADVSADGPDPSDGSDGGPGCVTDLSNVGTGDFHVRFSIRTTATPAVAMAVVNQRPACGTSTLWDVRMEPSGTLAAETDDGSVPGHYGVFSLASVNDGASHHVDVARLSGVLSITIDGAASGAAADVDALGSLPPLLVGSDVCDFADAGGDGTSPLVGAVTGVCLTR